MMGFSLLQVAVIGGGPQGCRIAAELAMSGGAFVKIYDRNIKPEQLRHFVDNEVYKCERLFPSDQLLAKRYMEEAVSRITTCKTLKEAVESCDFISEAIVEKLQDKVDLFRECEELAKPSCIFTTNTLTVSLEDIQASLMNPERLVGLRFLSPVCFIPFVELSTVGDTSASSSSASKVVHFMSDIGKICFRFRLDQTDEDSISAKSAKGAVAGAGASSGTGTLAKRNSLHTVRANMEQAGFIRLRLHEDEVWRHQYRESKVRFGLAVEQDKEPSCCVCLSEPPTVLLASCGHQVLCTNCARTIQTQGRGACPICRLPMRGVEEIVR